MLMKFHVQIVSILIIVFLVSSCTSKGDNQKDTTTVKPVSFIKTKGSNLVNSKGERIILKGTNLGNWLVPEGYMFKMDQVNSPYKIDELLQELIGPDSLNVFWKGFLDNYITHKDIKYLKSIGCNHIRVPFNYKMFTDDLYMGERNSGFKYLDRIIDWCKQEELYVLLDMHCAPGGQTGDNIDDSYGYPFLFKSKSSQDLMTEIWVKIAKKYKDEPIIVGYDIVNEPIAHYFKKELDVLNHELFLLYKRIIKEIRKVDTQHTIFLNGSIWSTNFDVFEELNDPNVVYEFHTYWVDVTKSVIQPYIDFRDKHQVPIYVGETGENTDQWIHDFRVLLDENDVSWCYWPYKKMNNTRGIMNFDEPESYHLISEYAKSDRSSYAKMRANRPNISEVQIALNKYLENSLYKNNFVNKGYTKALDFKVEMN